MYNFFSEKDKVNGRFVIDGKDFNHVVNVLRMKVNDQLLVSYQGKSSLCQIETIKSDALCAIVIEDDYRDTSLPIKLVLLQGLPKADKMELIMGKEFHPYPSYEDILYSVKY